MRHKTPQSGLKPSNIVFIYTHARGNTFTQSQHHKNATTKPPPCPCPPNTLILHGQNLSFLPNNQGQKWLAKAIPPPLVTFPRQTRHQSRRPNGKHTIHACIETPNRRTRRNTTESVGVSDAKMSSTSRSCRPKTPWGRRKTRAAGFSARLQSKQDAPNSCQAPVWVVVWRSEPHGPKIPNGGTAVTVKKTRSLSFR